MSATPATPITTVRDLAGLVAVLPTMMGFRPRRSIVVLCMSRGLVKVSMRADLEDTKVSEIAKSAILAARRSNADTLVAVAFVRNIGQWIAEALRDVALAIENETLDSDQPLTVRQLALVGRDGWCELPAFGSDIPALRPLAEIEEHPIRAHRVFTGHVVEPSREALFDRVKPGSDPTPDGFGPAYAGQQEAMNALSGPEMQEQLRELVDTVVEQSIEPARRDQRAVDGATLGRIAALVRNPLARDVATLAIDKEHAHPWFDFWAALARGTTGEAAVVPLALAGLAAWIAGNGALSQICHEVGSAIDDDHPLLRIVASLNEHCIPPDVWALMREEVMAKGLDAIEELDSVEEAS